MSTNAVLKSLFMGTAVAVVALPMASAAPITDPSDPLLNGASIITFDEVPVGTLDPVIGGVEFRGVSEAVKTRVVNPPGDPPEMPAPILENEASSPGNPSNGTAFDIVFSTPVAAMGLYLSQIGSPTFLEAFDVGGAVLADIEVVPPQASPVFRGLGGFGIGIARVRVRTEDSIFADTLYSTTQFLPVPAPPTYWLVLSGFAVLLRLRDRR